MPIAPLWRRLAAMLYDSFLVIGIWIVVGSLVLAAFGRENAQHVENGVIIFNPYYRACMWSAMMVSLVLFFGWFWTHSGQTLGMQAWKIRVLQVNDFPISWRQVLIRVAVATLSFAALGLGYWWVLFNKQQRSWPDIASNTYVAKIENFPKSATNP